MKISILNEDIEREGNVTTVTLTAEVRCSDPREFVLVNGAFISTGKSTCSKDDSFDELMGKRLARSRAYRSLYKQIHSEYREALKRIESSLRISEETMNKYERAIEAQNRDIDRLIETI